MGVLYITANVIKCVSELICRVTRTSMHYVVVIQEPALLAIPQLSADNVSRKILISYEFNSPLHCTPLVAAHCHCLSGSVIRF